MAMAFSSKLQLLFLISVSLIPISLCSNPNRPLSSFKTSTPDVHDLLPNYSLPKGLIPGNVKSYSLNSDSTFTIELTHECYVKFTDLVYYKTVLTGKLGDGKVSDVSGIEVKKLFAWLPITGIQVDGSSIEFQVGFLSEKLPASLFQEIPTCRNKEFQQSLLASN